MRNGFVARLTAQEFVLFEELRGHQGQVRSKEQLLLALYWQRHDGEEPEIKIIDVWICKMRRKLRRLGVEIDTVWGTGYRFVLLASERAAA